MSSKALSTLPMSSSIVVAETLGESAAIGGRVRLHGLEGLLVDGAKSLELGLGTLDGPFAPEPHRDREALVGALKCYLAAQDSAARNRYVLDFHGRSPICAEAV